jgi:hypothetical protein
MKHIVLTVLCLAVLLPGVARTQNASQAPSPQLATITFDCFWEQATPQRYTITVPSNGSALYVSQSVRESVDANGVADADYKQEFAISPPVRATIFQLAEQAGYFKGDFDFKKHAIANTGTKSLAYSDASRQFRTVYNWSENPAIDQLTKTFQGISATIERGRKLKFLRRFDKLGLEAELRGMEKMAASHELAELQIIAPLLDTIANDPTVLNIARQRAQRLLALSKGEAGH